MERIAAAGAAFRSLTENIDTTSPAGRMMMQMVASFADDAEHVIMRSRALYSDRTAA
jgi:DNA invertase Pin-like site-specific DNA recombinase